jgi:hypothetical protein
MDIREKFKRRVEEAAVATILQAIAAPPQRRDKRTSGDAPGAFDFWFDGGAGKTETGSINYEFTDGTRATVAAPCPSLSVTIVFPNGCVVAVQQHSWGAEHDR